MDILVKDIVKSPKLEIYYKEIENIILDERRKREKFYREIKEDDKVEFINGEVFLNSPVKSEHNIIAVLLSRLISTYVDKNKLGYVGFDKILISLSRNDYEPDICFFNKEKSDNFHSKQMQFPAPDFIAEVLSPSTEYNDRVIKFEDYAVHRVDEYWIIDPETKIIEQYFLKNEIYELSLKSDNGIVKSKAVTDFEIPIIAVFSEDENLKTLKNILNK